MSSVCGQVITAYLRAVRAIVDGYYEPANQGDESESGTIAYPVSDLIDEYNKKGLVGTRVEVTHGENGVHFVIERVSSTKDTISRSLSSCTLVISGDPDQTGGDPTKTITVTSTVGLHDKATGEKYTYTSKKGDEWTEDDFVLIGDISITRTG